MLVDDDEPACDDAGRADFPVLRARSAAGTTEVLKDGQREGRT
jgi:hypothetical protein